MNRAFDNKLESAPTQSVAIQLRVVETTHYQDAGYPVYLAWYIAGLAGLAFLMASF